MQIKKFKISIFNVSKMSKKVNFWHKILGIPCYPPALGRVERWRPEIQKEKNI